MIQDARVLQPEFVPQEVVYRDSEINGRVPNSSRVVTDSCGNRVTSGTYPEVTHARHN